MISLKLILAAVSGQYDRYLRTFKNVDPEQTRRVFTVLKCKRIDDDTFASVPSLHQKQLLNCFIDENNHLVGILIQQDPFRIFEIEIDVNPVTIKKTLPVDMEHVYERMGVQAFQEMSKLVPWWKIIQHCSIL